MAETTAMKIQILSDQHIDFKQNFSYCMNRMIPRCETLIIAGDICPHDIYEHERFIHEKILPNWKNTIIIPGNHEFWGNSSDDEFFGSKKKVWTKDGNTCTYMNNDVVEIDGVTFIGTTLWSYIGGDKHFQIQNGMGDYTYIQGNTVDKNNQRFLDNCEFLTNAVKDLDKKAVVITHHVPSFNLINDQYRGHSLNEAFAADMDTFIMMYGHKISHWIHGHSHDEIDRVFDGIRFIRNPMGYPQERNCNMDMVIRI